MTVIVNIIAEILPSRLIMQNIRHFEIWEKQGYHVTPVHFYFPIPDSREIDEKILNRRNEFKGININEMRQLQLLAVFTNSYRGEYARFPVNKTDIPYEYYLRNGVFESVDGEILYCMIRHFKPRRILEIGSGNSTYLIAQALEENRKDNGKQAIFEVIDPYPNESLKAGFPGLTKLIGEKVQNISVSMFGELQQNDILFIDSTHVLKIGSDVQYEYLEILPRLKREVIVHFHDIFLPAEYPSDWIKLKRWFWNEQYILQAFLQFNDSYEVLWAGHYMHLNYPDELKAAFSSYNPSSTLPGSFWIHRIK
jgi:hypothetical protein